MKQQQQKPFLPNVLLAGLEHFDKDRPETWHYGRFVNAVFEAMQTVFPISAKSVADYMALDTQTLNAVLRVETGHQFREIFEEWIWRRCWKVLCQNPDIQSDELAHCVGLSSRKTLWKFLHEHGIVKHNNEAYYRPRPRLIDIWARDKIPTETSNL